MSSVRQATFKGVIAYILLGLETCAFLPYIFARATYIPGALPDPKAPPALLCPAFRSPPPAGSCCPCPASHRMHCGVVHLFV